MKKGLILLSGGLDSTVLLYDLHRKENLLTAIFFNYGSKHNSQEVNMAIFHTLNLGVKLISIDLKQIGSYLNSSLINHGDKIPEGHYQHQTMKKTVVPFRNGIMLSIAIGMAESYNCTDVYISTHSGDHAIYPDCRPQFIKSFNEASINGTYKKVQVRSPFGGITKTEIVSIGKKLNVPLEETWSCYKGEEIQCGRCSTCFERREAFYLAKIKDKTNYRDKTPIENLIQEFAL